MYYKYVCIEFSTKWDLRLLHFLAHYYALDVQYVFTADKYVLLFE